MDTLDSLFASPSAQATTDAHPALPQPTLARWQPLRIGLVDKIVPHDALAAEVSALAEGIARQARCAVQQTKRCIRHGLESGLESGLSYEAQAFGLCFSTKEQKDRMRAFVTRRR